MKHIIITTLGIITILLLGATTTALHPQTTNENLTTQQIIHHFSTPTITTTQETTNIHLPECTNTLQITGAPILPTYIHTIEYPLGTRIKEISITTNTPQLQTITHDIQPAPRPLTSPNQPLPHNYIQPNPQIYTHNMYYPETWYSYKLTGGINNKNEHITILTLQITPIRYNPQQQTIQSIQDITMTITTDHQNTKTFLQDEYDLLILSYDRFTQLLKPLVDHKESHNIQTKLVPLTEIYDGTHFTTEGRDNPEKIKYFIKNAIEEWGITHVLLVGNFRKMPIRYAHLETDAGGTYEELKYPSDLYFSDIYDGNGNFSTWDTDEDGIYGEWPDPFAMEDIIDLRPDVHVGRLACMFGFEVFFTVRKIIDYEENTKGSNWFNNIVGIGGDTFDKKWEGGTDYNEGEEATEKAIEFMNGYNPIRIYTTLNNISKANMTQKINDGCGFLYYVGHGNPTFWATHYNGDYKNWTEGFGNKDILKLTHKGMYPIMMVGGCHNSQLDVSPLNLLIDPEHALYFSTHSFWCWSWAFVTRHNGGSIASIGSSGYGGVNIGDHNANSIPDCVEGADGWFETQFFRIYHEDQVDILGETYSQVVSDYIDNFPVFSDRYDCKIIETHVLMGDPTLKIGGY